MRGQQGGFIVDIYWTAGSLSEAHILSTKGGKCTVRAKTPDPLEVFHNQKTIAAERIDDRLWRFDTAAGRKYTLIAQREFPTR